MRAVIFAALFAVCAFAQDPSPDWLSYARASCPAGTKITSFSGGWDIPDSPHPSDALYTPWIGIDPSSHLNRFQVASSWLGSNWNFYTETDLWYPAFNPSRSSHKSRQWNTSSGNTLHGSIALTDDEAFYNLIQKDVNAMTDSRQSAFIPVDENHIDVIFTTLYVVFEKRAYCHDYPPNRQITFRNLTVECNGVPFTPTWTTSFVQDVCDFRAHVVDPKTITMTWNTNGKTDEAKAKLQYAENAKKRASMMEGKKAIRVPAGRLH